MSIFLSAGEASGDMVGAELLSEMRKLGFAEPAAAVGGKKLRAAGAEIIADSSKWGAIGIVQAAKVYPVVKAEHVRVKRRLNQQPPKLCVPIDFGYYNLHLCRDVRKVGSQILYFMPPGSWRRGRQGKDLPILADRIATPFKWSADILNQMGGNAEWVGHPAKQLAARYSEGTRDTVALMPGSRAQEIRLNLPVMAKAANAIDENLTIEIVVAPTTTKAAVESIWRSHSDRKITLTEDTSYATLKRSRAAIVCSGTATLEAAICRTPMVVIFNISPLMIAEYYIVRPKFKFLALPSILLDRAVVPELLGRAGRPDNVARHVNGLIAEGPERTAQLAAFDEVDEVLGPDTAITRTAEIAMSMLGEPCS